MLHFAAQKGYILPNALNVKFFTKWGGVTAQNKECRFELVE
jgi:hypothetical protein